MTSLRILLAAAAALVFAACAHSSDGRVDAFLLVGSLTVSNGAAPFAGDTRRLTTISPNGDGLRDAAAVRFSLSSAAGVHVEIAREAPAPHVVYTTTVDASAGDNTFRWAPAAAVPPRTYVVRLTVGAHR